MKGMMQVTPVPLMITISSQANGLKLVMYEGGPSVMEEGAIVSGANVQAVTDKAIAFNRDDAIRQPVQEQLNIWFDVVTNNARNNKPGEHARQTLGSSSPGEGREAWWWAS